jgi:hypothetical protein
MILGMGNLVLVQLLRMTCLRLFTGIGINLAEKLNSRLKNAFKPQYSSAPKHKLWVFNIKSSEYNDFNFLWLEQYGEGDQDQKYDFSFLNDPIIDDRYKDLPLWLNDSLENLLE